MSWRTNPLKEELLGSESRSKVTDLEPFCRCRCVCAFDPDDQLSYWWSAIVSCAFLYNLWVIPLRAGFFEINSNTFIIWLSLDYSMDCIYVLDIWKHMKTGYLEEGILQIKPLRMRSHYFNSIKFYLDCASLIPLDFLYLSFDYASIVRLPRLIKVFRFWQWTDRTERHTRNPIFLRGLFLFHYLCCCFHWNAALFYYIVESLQCAGMEMQYWFPYENVTTKFIDVTNFTNSTNATEFGPSFISLNCTDEHGIVFAKQEKQPTNLYLTALYWSIFTLCNLGQAPIRPRSIEGLIFFSAEMILGLLIFGIVMGTVSLIVSDFGHTKRQFQSKLNSLKVYMRRRRVPENLQQKVITWFDYLWVSNKFNQAEDSLDLLPQKLKSDIAIRVHLETLSRVEIFHDTERGFLCQLVLKLSPTLFSPGDYVCRKGEIGKEMFIVNSGRLNVLGNNDKVLATLQAGCYFGELSVLNLGAEGNRRTANVRSVGFSDLFSLSKEDLLSVLVDFPTARVKLESIAERRRAKYRKMNPSVYRRIKDPSQKTSKWGSSPGLLEANALLMASARRPSLTSEDGSERHAAILPVPNSQNCSAASLAQADFRTDSPYLVTPDSLRTPLKSALSNSRRASVAPAPHDSPVLLDHRPILGGALSVKGTILGGL